MTRASRLADWLGLNRATVAVLTIIGCLGLSDEIWRGFLSLHLQNVIAATDPNGAVITAVLVTGIISATTNLLEGFGYIIGGSVAHRLGARIALAISTFPMIIGFILMLDARRPTLIAIAALMMSNWEPLSVPATFDIVGSEVRKDRRTIAFAVQSIQKRVPKAIGPKIGAALFVAVGYHWNLIVALSLVFVALAVQLALTDKMKPKPDAARVPMREIMRTMPPELQRLLQAEILIRWGDWFARDFVVLYIFWLLTTRFGWTDDAATKAYGTLMALMAVTALATYIPVAKWVDRSESPRPFIGLTFVLFAIFPISLVVLPRISAATGLPVMVGLVLTFVMNGLREIGEPARKALITTGFHPDIRARAVGVYWGLRSFAFFPAPLVAAFLWSRIGPERTFLIGGAIGLAGTVYFGLRGRRV